MERKREKKGSIETRGRERERERRVIGHVEQRRE